MNNPTLFIGPMSKEIVDSVIDYVETNSVSIGLIPSRRQVDYESGYVNSWITETFCNYVREKTNKVLLVRDHGGPDQGYHTDNGVESFLIDCCFFDVVHIDPFKRFPAIKDAAKETVKFIKMGIQVNPQVYFEIGTEEAIKPLPPEKLKSFLDMVYTGLTDNEIKQVKYGVIQSGTALRENKNIGFYKKDWLEKSIKIVNDYGLISKEHNGDYLETNLIKEKFSIGLQTINIAPEFGKLQTKVYWENMNSVQRTKFYKLCLDSGRWKKWVDEDFDPENNIEDLVNICGHYVFSNPKFKKIKPPDLEGKINSTIHKRIFEILK